METVSHDPAVVPTAVAKQRTESAEILHWDESLETAPPRASGKLRVRLHYRGRGRPFPLEFPAEYSGQDYGRRAMNPQYPGCEATPPRGQRRFRMGSLAMFRRTTCSVWMGLVWMVAGVAWADVESGPAPGATVPPAKLLVLGEQEAYDEKEIVAERGEKLTVYVFVQATEWSRPMSRYLRGLDELLRPIDAEARVVAIWLTANVDETKNYLPRARQSLKFESTTLAVHPGDTLGPADWNVNTRASLTAVVTRGRKVVKSFAYVSLNETDLPPVKKTLEESRGK